MHHPDPNEKSHQQRMVKKDAVMRRLLAATLSVSSLWQLMPPTAAAQVTPLTAAGTNITNTATGTYEDPNNPGVPINTTSNPVTATVSEVAGVTVQSSAQDLNGGSVTANDPLNFTFIITNTGNDATAFSIPTSVTPQNGTLGTTALPVVGGVGIYVTKVNGVTLTSPVLLPTSGDTTDTAFITAVNNAGGNLAADGSIPAGNSIEVVVPVTVNATVIASDQVSVTLGNTGTYVGDVGTNTQNQPDSGAEPPAVGGDPTSQNDEIFTINVVTGGRTALPANGVREASSKNTQVVATEINRLALATVLKTRTGYSTSATPTVFTDDTLTYKLDLEVESTPPVGSTGITAAPLLPTSIRLNGAATDRILISDAIPVNTIIDVSAPPAATVTINGVTWTRVYSTAATTVSPLDATAAQNWLDTAPTAATTRIGYIANGPIGEGYTTVGATNAMTFRVVTTGLTTIPTDGITIANIAQVFGQTTAGPISPTNPLVYDESGDQNPNNYESGSPSVPAFTIPGTSPNGIANPTANGTDTNATPGPNTNSGTGPAGEDNVFTINPPGSILNGPQGAADAIGPGNSNNTDFVNKSIAVPPGIAPGGTIPTTSVVTFTNTAQNPATNLAQLDNVTLEPITAALAASSTGLATTDFELPGANNGAPLPLNTTVTIAHPVGTPTNTATYQLLAGGFSLVSSTTGVTPDAAPKPVNIGTLGIGLSQNYNVTVTLPIGAAVTTGYSVPIVAYVDSNTANTTAGLNGFKSTNSDAPFNIKIDRVYTGYLELLKLSRVVQGTGPAVVTTPTDEGLFTNTAKNPAPGNILEYLLTYRNISTPASGTSNVILNANDIVITEDGAAGTNNWATTTLNVANTATVALDGTIPGAATPTFNAVITFFNGAAASTTVDPNVTRYLNSIPTLTPGQQGFFRFQRRVK